MAKKLTFNDEAITKIATVDARPLVERVTRQIANGAKAAAGRVNGRYVRTFTTFGVVQSGQRFRGAIIVVSKDEGRQQAGRDALVARIRAAA